MAGECSTAARREEDGMVVRQQAGQESTQKQGKAEPRGQRNKKTVQTSKCP